MLKTLGRTHTAEDTAAAVRLARSCGFNNISLDLMIALPGSDIKSLESDLEFLSGFCAPHISVYILKVEENTAFYKRCGTLDLPDGDGAAEQYLFMCGYLEKGDTAITKFQIFALKIMKAAITLNTGTARNIWE